MPGPNRESRRVRTAAQLERKRQLDRETQRLNRERNKKHMSMVESELNQLRQDFAGLSTKLERLAEFVSSCRGSAGRRPAVDREPGSPRLVQSSLKPVSEIALAWICVYGYFQGNVCIDNDDDAPIDPVMVSAMTEGDPFHSDMETPGQQDLQLQIHQFQWYQNPCWSSEASNQLLTGTGFIQSLPPSLTSPSPDIPNANTKTDTQDPKTPQTEIPTTIATSGSCFCFILHQSPFECMEYRALQLLLSAHMVINQNPVAAQLYPRTPSMANLLLLDNDSNPVVNMLGQVMKRLRPPSLVDTMGVYLIMYRLFRVRLLPYLLPDLTLKKKLIYDSGG